jgi:DNA polymerase III delta prime subunit
MWIIDEADHMTGLAKIEFLSTLDSAYFPRNMIIILTCNDTKGFEPRFLSRCHTIRFSSYGMTDAIAAFLEGVWEKEGGPKGHVDFMRLVKESRNNIRDCLMQLETELMTI